MSKTPFVIFGIFAAVCVLVLPFIALGKEGDEGAAIVEVAPEDQEAKELFATNCGACHTLAAAGTDGVVGPNLDDLLVQSGTNTAEAYEGLYTRVLTTIHCGFPPGGGRMPAGILLDQEAKNAARFVGAYAGQIDRGPTVDTATVETPDPGPCPE